LTEADAMESTPVPPRPSARAAELAHWLRERGDGEAAERATALAVVVADWERTVLQSAGDALAVHHDIRNALTGVLGNAQLVLMGAGGDAPGVRRRLESLVHEAERIREITDRLSKARTGFLSNEEGDGRGEAA
jgi:signal transduction histidine kinase